MLKHINGAITPEVIYYHHRGASIAAYDLNKGIMKWRIGLGR